MEEKKYDIYFVAIKLIEQLYREKEIPKYMFVNILDEYADKIDVSKFLNFNEEEAN